MSQSHPLLRKNDFPFFTARIRNFKNILRKQDKKDGLGHQIWRAVILFVISLAKRKGSNSNWKFISNYAKADAVQVFFIQYFTLNQRVKNVKEIATKTLPVSADVKYFGIWISPEFKYALQLISFFKLVNIIRNSFNTNVLHYNHIYFY